MVVDFPVRLQSQLKWSPSVYNKLPNGTVVVRKIFSEVVVVTLIRDVNYFLVTLFLQSLMVKSIANFLWACNISIPKQQ